MNMICLRWVDIGWTGFDGIVYELSWVGLGWHGLAWIDFVWVQISCNGSDLG